MLAEFVNRYDSGIRYADDQVGQILDHLLTSDHGENLFDNGRYVSHRWFTYDKEIRIPLIAKLAGNDAGAKRVDEFVEIVDIHATILDLFGLESPVPIHGRGLLELARNEESDDPRTFVVGVAPDTGSFYVRTTDWKCISEKDPEGVERILRRNLRCEKGFDPWGEELIGEELFRIQEDPAERQNVAASHAGDATSSRELGLAWRAAQQRFNEEWYSQKGDATELNEEELDRLRELGYVGGDEDSNED